MPEIDFQAEYVDGREGEYCTGNDYAGAGSYALDYHVLGEGVTLFEGSREAYCDDGDRNCRFEDLTHLEPEVCGCCREQYGHQQAHADRINRYFLFLLFHKKS